MPADPRTFERLRGATPIWSRTARRDLRQDLARPIGPVREALVRDLGGIERRNDFIIGFQHESDARRYLDEMSERLGKFALTLHPEKTRLIEFGRFAAERRERRGLGKPETFNFLGFTFICDKTRTGKFQLKRKSRRDRMRTKLTMIKEEMSKRMHQPIPTRGNGCGMSSKATSTTTRCRPTTVHWARSGTMSPTSGDARCGDAVRKIGSRGHS
jgi:hypothetical protein